MSKRDITVIIAAIAFCLSAAQGQSTQDILEAAGIKGGIVVHLGCTDGKLIEHVLASFTEDRYFIAAAETGKVPATLCEDRIRADSAACFKARYRSTF